MKSLIAKYIVLPFKKFPYFGRLRFWCLYWAYRVTGWHIRHKEWDFVLEYLPPLMKGQDVKILDVGCARNLFCHEVVARGYDLRGIDLEKPNFRYPGVFLQEDIKRYIGHQFDFVTCISVLEHIEKDRVRCIENMIKSLKFGGRLLLTIPTKEFAQGHPWIGFTVLDILSMLNGKAIICEVEEKAGQFCMAIERIL